MTGTYRIRDLGHLDGDVLLFGGAYSNLQAMQAMSAEAERRGIASENMICTGDAVGYCADAAAVVGMLQQAGYPAIAGNVEKQLAAGAEDCGCGFKEGSICDRLSAAWFSHARSQMSPDMLRWMADLPDIIAFTHLGRRHAVVHGGLSDIARFIWPVTGSDDLRREFELASAILGPVDTIVAGHSGIAFERSLGERTWINAGVIGLPPHDGRNMTRFAVLTDAGCRIERLSYDTEAAARAMRKAGLPDDYAGALETGLWPSEEILPESLRRVQDRANG